VCDRYGLVTIPSGCELLGEDFLELQRRDVGDKVTEQRWLIVPERWEPLDGAAAQRPRRGRSV
jgi:hypothetical protein